MTASTAARTASAPVDREAAEARFTEIYAEQNRRLTQWFYWHLPESVRGRAEDLAQETFLNLWEHLLKGRSVDYPFALLKRIGQRRMADQLSVRARDAEAVLMDVTDPEAPSVETIGHSSRYAAGEPELALVAAELETAMERMRDASALWRKLHAESGKYKARPKPPGWVDPNPGRTAKVDAARVEIRIRRDEALVELQEACRAVGNLRADLERAAGCAWQSSCGWPPRSLATGGTAGVHCQTRR